MDKYHNIFEEKGYQTLVIHVAKFKERAASIERQMKQTGLGFHYIIKGDIDDINDDILSRYFKDGCDNMYRPSPFTSCALKHFYAYEYILEHNLPGALILEDDAILDSNFLPKLNQSIIEYEINYSEEAVIISYENSALTFVPHSKREKGKMLYPANKDRYTGGYFINIWAAKAILQEVEKNKCEMAIDGFHNYLLHQDKLLYLWCHPTIIEQGTCIGKFDSSLSKDDWLLRIRWIFKLYYKKLLYYFR